MMALYILYNLIVYQVRILRTNISFVSRWQLVASECWTQGEMIIDFNS